MSAPKARGGRGAAVHAGSPSLGRSRGARRRAAAGRHALPGRPELRAEYARDIAPRTEAALGRVLAEVYGAPAAVLPRAPSTSARGPARRDGVLRARFGESLEVVAVDRVAGLGVGPRQPGGRAAGRHRKLRPGRRRAPPERALRRPRVGGARGAPRAPGPRLGEGVARAERPPDPDRARAARDLARAARVARPAHHGRPPRRRPLLLDRPLPRARPRARLVPRRRARSVAAPRRLQLPGPPRRTHPRAPDLFRVVSDPLREKGRLRLFGCGPTGRHPLVRLDRHRSPANAAFSDLVRGDAAAVAPTHLEADGLRVTAETVVTPSS